MKHMPHWLSGPSSLYPKTFRFKYECTELCTLRQINFGLHGYSWCAFRGSSVLMRNGLWMPVHEAHLHTGHVIGPRDIQAAGAGKHAEGWRNSMADVTEKTQEESK